MDSECGLTPPLSLKKPARQYYEDFVDAYDGFRITPPNEERACSSKPTESEVDLLTVLWDREKATIRELFEALNRSRPVVYTGVLKLLQITTEKGLVVRDETERAHVYRAAIKREVTQCRFVRDLSERFFAGSAAQLALHALEMNRRPKKSSMRFESC